MNTSIQIILYSMIKADQKRLPLSVPKNTHGDPFSDFINFAEINNLKWSLNIGLFGPNLHISNETSSISIIHNPNSSGDKFEVMCDAKLDYMFKYAASYCGMRSYISSGHIISLIAALGMKNNKIIRKQK